MGIDRIGKGPPSPPTEAPQRNAPSAPARSSEASRPFEVHEKSPSQAPRAPDPLAGPTPLERLHAGEIDIDGYLNLKVEEATVHLRGLSPAEMNAVRRMLRDQLVSDPALGDLVQQATGYLPQPKSE
jgi:hypothetical protein